MVEKAKMKEPTAAQYDVHFKKQVVGNPKQRKKNQWHRRGFYEIAKSFLPKDKGVIELGCGDGFFTNFLDEGQGYLGIDFCTVLINHGRKMYPNHTFIQADVREPGLSMLFTDKFSYVSIEVMEHIKNDLEVIASIPTGSDFIFSVPSRDNMFHVRYFKSFDQIKDRYKHLLEFLDHGKHETTQGNFIRVSKTIRK